jgi:hypothetical protein
LPAKELNGCTSTLSYRFSISTKCVAAFGILRMLAGLNYFISYYDHSAAKWRLRFDHCCEFHARRFIKINRLSSLFSEICQADVFGG